MAKRPEPIRFHNFPCPACGSLVTPAVSGARSYCPNCRAELTQAMRGMLSVSRMNRIKGGVIGFATCPKCATVVFARKNTGPEDDEYWTCARCNSLVFV
jgi:DNA-directed RNA polymerase subunit M/transcription elongation factor TFIIS